MNQDIIHQRKTEPGPAENQVLKSLGQIAAEQDSSVGGKAYNLALLANRGFSVPDAVALSSLPQDAAQWRQLMAWWNTAGRPKLAARSSARGEDSGNASFAGQLTSIIGIDSEEDLRKALETCFASIDRVASRAYRQHFGQKLGGMNVLVQKMIDPLFSGVFFSRDPRGGQGWITEVVRGFGESLVSGQRTPLRFSEHDRSSLRPPDASWKDEFLGSVTAAGQAAKEALGFDVDMEWAIDHEGKLWVLQARPITTTGNKEPEPRKRLKRELQRLRSSNDATTTWDTQTFAEWTDLPTPLSLDIWRHAFSGEGAFLKALKELGYEGETEIEGGSLLDSVLGRACLNLNRLQPEFFGRIPYSTSPLPRPHLEFDWRKIDFQTILHAPAAIARMAKVAWKIQGQHAELLQSCERALEEQTARPHWFPPVLIDRFMTSARDFAGETLKWPFVLAILAEATLNGLEEVLAQDVGHERARALVRDWMSYGLSTVTCKMDREYQAACADSSLRTAFLESYGHRGPGELDLAKKRWRELGDDAFAAAAAVPTRFPLPKSPGIEDDIEKNVHAIRKSYVAREWAYLKSLLELRERWKMEIMKPYFALRLSALEIGKRLGHGDDVFWLHLKELESGRLGDEAGAWILDRKKDAGIFRKFALPRVFSLAQIDDLARERAAPPTKSEWFGEPLSSGLAYGTVRIVHDPADVRLDEWPPTTILVAEATDPGWTPLFQRAAGIVVERGGVLSHCAIVAREMGLPAVSQILGCTNFLKDGDHVWVDGNLGRVELAGNS